MLEAKLINVEGLSWVHEIMDTYSYTSVYILRMRRSTMQHLTDMTDE